MTTAGNRRQGAFTLIEMLAVVMIFGLMAAVVIPNIGGLQTRALRSQAEHIISQLELARQRSIVTGIPHRLYLDLDGSAYRIEWWVTEAAALGEEPPAAEPLDTRGNTPLELAPPLAEQRDYHPLPGLLGKISLLEESIHFAGVETPEGWSDRGEVSVAFQSDGTTEYTEIVLDSQDGGSLTLDVLPLADAVRIRSEAL